METIDNVIRNRMKSGKAAGYDNLTPDHILYSHPILVTHLRNIFNLMLKHSYVPDEFGKRVIVPLVKDKRGDLFSVLAIIEVLRSALLYQKSLSCVCLTSLATS